MKIITWLAAGLTVLVALGLGASRVHHAGIRRTSLAGRTSFEDTADGSGTRFVFKQAPKGQATATDPFVISGLCRAGAPGAIPGKSASPPLHIHTKQTECFRIISGRFAYTLEGKEGQLGPADTKSKPLCIPPGAVHTFWNAANSTDLDVEVTLTPALNSEQFFRTFCGLGTDFGQIEAVNPLQLILTFVHGNLVLADVPKPLWFVFQHLLAPLSKLAGLQPFYESYTNSD
eukprot:jgi/Astpho2/6946/Aster-x0295